MSLRKSDFAYSLPSHLIARAPAEQRTNSRLMVVGTETNTHLRFSDLTQLLRPDDTLVVNNTKVIKARLLAKKDSGGRAEILVERITDTHEALCQVAVSKPLKPNRTLNCFNHEIRVLMRKGEFYLLRFEQPVLEFLDLYGATPLPPYIDRAAVNADEQRYQTVYAKEPGAVAAPTAGLHFDADLLSNIRSMGIAVENVTLHVGAGTFQPLREEELSKHVMHQERFEISASTLERIIRRSGRLIAVGTTVVRTLETWAQTGKLSGETDLFIAPGFKFKMVDALITNFHLPESTLIMLVSAFCGRERILKAYQEAIDKSYRFFSYGDAMFLERMHV